MEHVANTDQAHAWNGYEGTQWARNQDRWDAVNNAFNGPLLDAAAIGAREHVLDVGCGAGSTTRLAARRAAEGRAMGLDLSAPMLERARESTRDEGPSNASFTQGDAQSHPFAPDTFDVAISRYGLMFFADPVAAFINIASALRPGGRLAFVCPAEADGNEWLQALVALRGILPFGEFGAPGSPGMFSLADPERTVRLLSDAGFEASDAVRVHADGVWGRDAGDAAEFLLGSGPGRHLLEQVGSEEQRLARRTLANALRPHERGDAVLLRSSSWLVTARRPEH
ncbi:class I SAM-dependent methyltransferase [Streptomyces sp. NPDC056708]|uniref:class I SAM-dependent methyltransferase n=1 Tax=unclassified Streptomyces TaxID=2593676 RepID=UPI0036D04406